jgi:hypothetical protein
LSSLSRRKPTSDVPCRVAGTPSLGSSTARPLRPRAPGSAYRFHGRPFQGHARVHRRHQTWSPPPG